MSQTIEAIVQGGHKIKPHHRYSLLTKKQWLIRSKEDKSWKKIHDVEKRGETLILCCTKVK